MFAARDAWRAGARAVAVALAAVTLGLLAGCGGGDDDGGDAKAQSGTSGGAEEISYKRAGELADIDDRLVDDPPGVKADVDEVLEDLQVSIALVQGLMACAELSTVAEMAVAQSVGSNDRRACRDVVDAIGEKRRKLGQKSPLSKVLSVSVRGNEATARVLYPDGEIRYIPFVEDSDVVWRASSLDLVDDEAVEPSPEGPGSDKSDPRGLSERELIEEVVYDLEGDFLLGKGSSVCFELTEDGQREIEQSGIGNGGCAQRIPTITKRALARGYQPRYSRIGKVTIDGKRATAVVKPTLRPRQQVHFVKTEGLDGGWKATSVRDIGVDLDKLQ
jgi:hypothetical protein